MCEALRKIKDSNFPLHSRRAERCSTHAHPFPRPPCPNPRHDGGGSGRLVRGSNRWTGHANGRGPLKYLCLLVLFDDSGEINNIILTVGETYATKPSGHGFDNTTLRPRLSVVTDHSGSGGLRNQPRNNDASVTARATASVNQFSVEGRAKVGTQLKCYFPKGISLCPPSITDTRKGSKIHPRVRDHASFEHWCLARDCRPEAPNQDGRNVSAQGFMITMDPCAQKQPIRRNPQP